MSTKRRPNKIATARVVDSLAVALEFLFNDPRVLQLCKAADRRDVIMAIHEVYDWLHLADDFWVDE
jgi:hypothetical protein